MCTCTKPRYKGAKLTARGVSLRSKVGNLYEHQAVRGTLAGRGWSRAREKENCLTLIHILFSPRGKKKGDAERANLDGRGLVAQGMADRGAA